LLTRASGGAGVIGMAYDWVKIKNEYISGTISYRDIAEKYGVPFTTLRDHAKKDDWVGARQEQRDRIMSVTAQKTVDAISKDEADAFARIRNAALKATAIIEEALDQTKSKNGKISTYRLRQAVQSLKDVASIQILPDLAKAPDSSEQPRLAETIREVTEKEDVWKGCS